METFSYLVIHLCIILCFTIHKLQHIIISHNKTQSKVIVVFNVTIHCNFLCKHNHVILQLHLPIYSQMRKEQWNESI